MCVCTLFLTVPLAFSPSFLFFPVVQERWFACTSEVFAYFKEEGGELMSSVPLKNITSVGGTGERAEGRGKERRVKRDRGGRNAYEGGYFCLLLSFTNPLSISFFFSLSLLFSLLSRSRRPTLL